MQRLKGKKLHIRVLAVVSLGILLYVGARVCFFIIGGFSPIPFVWLLEPQYRQATDFVSGVAWVEVKANVWQQIDTRGNVLVDDFKVNSVSCYDKETGLAPFRTIDFNQGFINLSGEIVISPDYSLALDFQHGVAVVAKKLNGEYRYGIIDREGRVVLPLMYDLILPFPPNIFSARKDGKRVYIDVKGAVLLPASYDMIYGIKTKDPFGVSKNGKTDFIDAKGKTVIDLQFGKNLGPLNPYQFTEGLAVVVLPDAVHKEGELPQNGVINEKGELLFTLPGYAIGKYREGFVVVHSSNDVYGLVNRKGNWYPLPSYLEVDFFNGYVSEGILRVKVLEKYGKYKKRMYGYLKVKVDPNH